jgi:hypothetical protein
MLIAAVALGSGCQSSKTGRAKPRYRAVEGSFADSTARNTFIEQRTEALVKKGVDRDTAAARASRAWFAHAPVPSEVPTAYELQRRAAEGEITAYLEKRKESGSR